MTLFQEPDFASLSGARVVRLAVHPDLTRMGYGSRALDLLTHYYQGDIRPLKPAGTPSGARAGGETPGGNTGDPPPTGVHSRTLHSETLAPRAHLPPLLLTLGQRPAEQLHWLGASFGLTEPLYAFWHKSGFRPVYLRQTKNGARMLGVGGRRGSVVRMCGDGGLSLLALHQAWCEAR
jgi:N-acetyltransferase 10